MGTEAQTRQEIIDKRLLKASWNVNDPSQVTSELDIWIGLPEGVNTAQHKHQGHQYTDYALLGKDGYPLAVVEAKKTSKDARVGLMNLIMHGIRHPNIDQKDTLSKTYDEDSHFDAIMANPPFKGSLDKGDINKSFSLSTTKTELLFIKRIFNSLKIGGRCEVIVPDGVLFGGSRAHKDARKILIEQCELQGVISMPSGVCKPYAGVSTAILVFVKGGATENVWFYDMQADGYSLDDKPDKVEDNDLPDIVEKWKARKSDNENTRKYKSFFVPKEEIVSNEYDLSINRYKEVEYEEVIYEKPEAILKQIKNIEAEIQLGVSELEKQIK